jgi:hypothetical protein
MQLLWCSPAQASQFFAYALQKWRTAISPIIQQSRQAISGGFLTRPERGGGIWSASAGFPSLPSDLREAYGDLTVRSHVAFTLQIGHGRILPRQKMRGHALCTLRNSVSSRCKNCCSQHPFLCTEIIASAHDSNCHIADGRRRADSMRNLRKLLRARGRRNPAPATQQKQDGPRPLRARQWRLGSALRDGKWARRNQRINPPSCRHRTGCVICCPSRRHSADHLPPF